MGIPPHSLPRIMHVRSDVQGRDTMMSPPDRLTIFVPRRQRVEQRNEAGVGVQRVQILESVRRESEPDESVTKPVVAQHELDTARALLAAQITTDTPTASVIKSKMLALEVLRVAAQISRKWLRPNGIGYFCEGPRSRVATRKPPQAGFTVRLEFT
ncbi:hypothetical protein [Nocardia sp. NPDC051981]|uniref:hypothetical protein n=1 Tax=Nocardia sp. NPDC051981 TaxID=3155417 RepID=UPI003413C6A7